jgi:pyruvate,water dikinase
MDKHDAYVVWLEELTNDDVDIVGGKNASLGEMYSNLKEKGVNVPDGFAITAKGYRRFLDASNALDRIRDILSDLDTSDMDNLSDRGSKVRALIRNLEFPADLRTAIEEDYVNLEQKYGKRCDVAVRSSATAEDLPDASFAGQQETYLNIRGVEDLLDACRRCFASLFTNRAISYRQDKGFDHFSVYLSIAVQKMVRSDLACSGVMFTIDTESGFRDAIYITGAWGLGENVVQGAVNPDEWYVYKPTLKQGYAPIIMRNVGEKAVKMVYTTDAKQPTKNVSTPDEDRRRMVLSDDEVIQLAHMGAAIEEHYSEKAGQQRPMDIEWAKDGQTGEALIVQARPETVHSIKDTATITKHVLQGEGEVLVTGQSVGDRIGTGAVQVIQQASLISQFKAGEVLVTDMTDPDWEPIMKVASAIITNRGGRTCHAAIISRELGIPCVVGAGDATEKLTDGRTVTVDCSQGSTGYIYDGAVDFEVRETDLQELPRIKTQIMLNLASPEQAFEKSFLPNAGVGLAREEFIINSYIKVHPLALLRYDDLTDTHARHVIADMTRDYDSKTDYFVDRLAEGVAMIAAAFHPKKVIVRLSDFKTNEYANLIGGAQFEPKEENPMIGWRGASRYYAEAYKDAFGLECKAMLKIREEMGLKNVEVMIPFCRTLTEARQVIDTMAEYGLRQGEDGLKVIGMCEIPSNVILAEQFLDIFDGYSIGTNDLTQLLLGVDRDSELVSHVYDERDESVKTFVKQVIEAAQRKGKYIGICGQAPSDHPEFAEFIVRCGIDTMSLNPDTVLSTWMAVADLEKDLKS